MLTLIPGTGILIGGREHVIPGTDHVISACRSYHLMRCGFRADRGQPDYLWHLDPGRRWLSINWVDGPAKLFGWSADVWPLAFDLLDEWTRRGRAIVHCDQGMSRSPTLVMAYLAKRTPLLPDDFVPAAMQFQHLYPTWKPKMSGVCGWVRDHWETLH